MMLEKTSGVVMLVCPSPNLFSPGAIRPPSTSPLAGETKATSLRSLKVAMIGESATMTTTGVAVQHKVSVTMTAAHALLVREEAAAAEAEVGYVKVRLALPAAALLQTGEADVSSAGKKVTFPEIARIPHRAVQAGELVDLKPASSATRRVTFLKIAPMKAKAAETEWEAEAMVVPLRALNATKWVTLLEIVHLIRATNARETKMVARTVEVALDAEPAETHLPLMITVAHGMQTMQVVTTIGTMTRWSLRLPRTGTHLALITTLAEAFGVLQAGIPLLRATHGTNLRKTTMLGALPLLLSSNRTTAQDGSEACETINIKYMRMLQVD
jgi:hypothetical protein